MGKAHIKAKKRVIDGHEFHSTEEAEYYEYLKVQDDVVDIVIQPQYTFMNAFYIKCGRCDEGYVTSPRTGNKIKCKTCRGTAKRKRQPWTYTGDFKVTYSNGKSEVIDIKGGWKNERFNLVRKMYEHTYGKELAVIVKDKKKGWVRK